MGKKVFAFLCVCILILSLSGCATCSKQNDLELQGLRNQVAVLEAQVSGRDSEIAALRESLRQAEEQGVAAGEVKSKPTAKQIQTALNNAGFNPGPIDGKIGRQTKEAIKKFQEANSLKADGKAGKETWAVLRQYLEKGIK